MHTGPGNWRIPCLPRPQLVFDGTNGTLTYQKDTAATDMSLVIQRSCNLLNRTTMATTDQTIRATLPAPPDGAPYLYRLQAILPP